jgi:hypothetical protein
MRRLLIAAVLAAGVFAGCGDTATAERPGKPAVYERIAAMKSCAKLQREFDIAMDNVERYPGGSPKRDVPMAYADAVMERMDEVGCS